MNLTSTNSRSTFLDALVEHVSPEYAHFHKRCVSVQQPSADRPRPVVHFADGTSVEADVVILADGIKGAGREAVTGTDPKNNIAFSNTICYRGLVPVAEVKANGVQLDLTHRPTCFMGKSKVPHTRSYHSEKVDTDH